MPNVELERLEFLPGVAHELGWYVYALRDPRDGVVFYVGKGKGNRAYQHARQAKAASGSILPPKVEQINAIHAAGREVIVEIVRYRLPDADAAFAVEAAVIDALTLGVPAKLTNLVAGHSKDEQGWSSLERLRHLAAAPIDIPAELRPCLLVRPNQRYRYSMDPDEMWEVTRKSWKIRRRTYKYAFCVHGAIVRGVWEVTGWDERNCDWNPGGRRALAGKPAEDLWPTYVGGYVGKYLPTRGGQIPFTILLPDRAA